MLSSQSTLHQQLITPGHQELQDLVKHQNEISPRAPPPQPQSPTQQAPKCPSTHDASVEGNR